MVWLRCDAEAVAEAQILWRRRLARRRNRLLINPMTVRQYLDLLSFGPNGWGDEMCVGALITLALGALSFFLGLIAAIPCAAAKVWGGQATRRTAQIYTSVVRGVPELLVIYLIFFGGNSTVMAVARLFGYNQYIELTPFLVGTAAISIVSAAYSCEVVRGALEVLPVGQIEASRSLGLSRAQTFHLVVAPQMMRIALPGLGNVWQVTVKSTSLVSVTALAELMRVSYVAAGSTRQPILFYTTAAALYVAITLMAKGLSAVLSIRFPYVYRKENL